MSGLMPQLDPRRPASQSAGEPSLAEPGLAVTFVTISARQIEDHGC
jgi:hypothetical protein